MQILGQVKVILKLNKFTWKTTVLVSKKLNYAIILGLDFIKKTSMVVDLKNNNCYLGFKPSLVFEFKHSVGKFPISINNNVKTVNIGCSEVRDKIMQLIENNPDVYTNKIGNSLDYEYTIKLIDPQRIQMKSQRLEGTISTPRWSPSCSPWDPGIDKDGGVLNNAEMESKLLSTGARCRPGWRDSQRLEEETTAEAVEGPGAKDGRSQEGDRRASLRQQWRDWRKAGGRPGTDGRQLIPFKVVFVPR